MSMKNFLFFISILTLFINLSPAVSYGAIREPAVAGKFYPSDPTELKAMVSGHLNAAKDLPAIDGQIIAIIVPHAGLIYSGSVAAYAYKLLENSPINRVILCGPSHQYGFQGISVYGPGVIWKSPLGNISCDDSLCNVLLKHDRGIDTLAAAHSREHCLEVQLPYLQTVLKDFRIVPLIMGNPDDNAVKLLTDALELMPSDARTIMIASTDWQHYRPALAGGKMDSLGMDCLLNLDADRLLQNLHNGKTELCGGGAAVAVIKAAVAKGANRVKILKYRDSGDVTGDKSSVVGYVAAVLYKESDIKDKKPVKNSMTTSNDKELAAKFNLDEPGKKRLLQIARESLTSYIKDNKIPEFEVPENLQKFGAAFVTLEENGMLRGCIGHTTATEPLYKTVSICAVQAGVSDPRFPPVRADEIGRLHIEISVLTPMEKIGSFDEIKVGRDGLMIFKGNQRGLLLPQVAVEYGWSATEFLEQTCVKAGLDRQAYKSPDAVVYRFQAVIFGE